MSLLDAREISKGFGGTTLFADASVRIDPGERWALVGHNGSGKTTLLEIVAGNATPDAGEITRRRGLEVGYLPQETDEHTDDPLLFFVESVDGELQRVRDSLAEMTARVQNTDPSKELLEKLGELQHRFEHLGGYTLQAEAERILAGLGFSPDQLTKPLATFSGGWRMRALLARILLKKPDLILLDEPTNHLDIESLLWLENFVSDSPSAFLIVTHDRAFLDRIATGVFALEPEGLVRHRGNFTDYLKGLDLRRTQQQAAHDNYMKKRAQTERFVERFRSKATKARQAQSRIKMMEKQEPVAAPVSNERAGPAIRFAVPPRSGKEVASLERVSAGYGDTLVYEGLDFRIDRGEKVALIGPNGAGKSTLLKLLSGEVSPRGGEVKLGHNVTRSYFAQHQLEQLNPANTLLEEMAAGGGLRTELEMRSLLGGFLFSGEDVEKRVSVLSGGEKSRLVMAKILSQPGNLLLMDEPTNHLDMAACEVLKSALEKFSGTLCLITHDRDLINRVVDRVVWVERGRIESYHGNYDDFERARRNERMRTQQVAQLEEPKPGKTAPAESRKEQRRRQAEERKRLNEATGPLRKRLAKLESEIGEMEEELAGVDVLLADSEVYNDSARAKELFKSRNTLIRRIERATGEWEMKGEELEAVENGFRDGGN